MLELAVAVKNWGKSGKQTLRGEPLADFAGRFWSGKRISGVLRPKALCKSAGKELPKAGYVRMGSNRRAAGNAVSRAALMTSRNIVLRAC